MSDANTPVQTCLITGASRGIGAAMSEALAGKGYSVLGTARTPAPDSALLPLDVTDAASVAALGTFLAGKTLDLLVCNAGVYLDKGQKLDGYPAQMWADSFAANVTGVFLTIQTLLPHLRKAAAAHGLARVAIISSQMGSNTRAPGGSYIYRASKAAALNLGRNMARDLAAERIAVGIYHPGWVRTDMGGRMAEISATESAAGLAERFTSLSLGTSGCFQTWDGRDHAL